MNQSESRSIVAIVLCVLLYFGYQQYLGWKYPDLNKPQPKVTAVDPEASQGQGTAPMATTPSAAGPQGESAAPTVTALPAEQLVIDTEQATWRFSQDLGGLEAVILKRYGSEKAAESQPVNLLDTPMALQGTLDTKNLTPARGVFHAERQGQALRLWRDAGTVRIAQEYVVAPSGYEGELKVSFTNLGQAPIDLTGGLLTHETIHPKKSSSVLGFIPGTITARDQLIYHADGDTHWLDLEPFCKGEEDPVKIVNEPIGYFGIDRHYFLAAVEPKAKTGSLRGEHLASNAAGCTLAFVNFDTLGSLMPGETTTLEYRLFFGPKELDTMTAHSPALASALHLGMFDFIARPLLMVIEGFYRVTKNYGVAIILLTILLKVLFYPLVKASSTSMHKMKKLNPQMQAIRDKWKDDRQRQQQELIKFMGQHKINPMKGCLPILPQIPVFFAFYQVLQTSIKLRHAPFFGWIQDLSAMDPFFVTPLLMGVAMMVQQKLTPTTGMDKTQEKILMFMPIMFTAMMLTLPAGLTLYMLTNTVVGIAQQKWLYKRLDKLEA